jgi:hypothetical protein
MLITVFLVWERFNSSLKAEHKTIQLHRAREKRKKEDTLLCSRVNRGLLTSVLTLQVFYLRLFLWWLWFVILLDL